MLIVARREDEKKNKNKEKRVRKLKRKREKEENEMDTLEGNIETVEMGDVAQRPQKRRKVALPSKRKYVKKQNKMMGREEMDVETTAELSERAAAARAAAIAATNAVKMATEDPTRDSAIAMTV